VVDPVETALPSGLTTLHTVPPEDDGKTHERTVVGGVVEHVAHVNVRSLESAPPPLSGAVVLTFRVEGTAPIIAGVTVSQLGLPLAPPVCKT
jgi:hypothetical protein